MTSFVICTTHKDFNLVDEIIQSPHLDPPHHRPTALLTSYSLRPKVLVFLDIHRFCYASRYNIYLGASRKVKTTNNLGRRKYTLIYMHRLEDYPRQLA